MTATTAQEVPAKPAGTSSRRRIAAGAVTAYILVAVGLPAVVDAYTISLASTAVALALLALSTQLLTGVAGLPSLGQAAYFGAGAYTTALLAGEGVTFAPAQLGLAMLAGAGAAAVTAPLVLRTRGTTFLLVSFAVQQLAATAASQWGSVTGGDGGLHVAAITLWPGAAAVTGDGYLYWYVLAVFLALSAAMALLLTSTLGLALRGCADHEPRMAALGHRVTGQLTAAYVIAGAVAAGGGALLVAAHRYVSPADLGFEVAALALLAAAIGAGSMRGAVAGAVLVVAARDLVGARTGGHGAAVLGLLLLCVVYLRPHLARAARTVTDLRWGRRAR